MSQLPASAAHCALCTRLTRWPSAVSAVASPQDLMLNDLGAVLLSERNAPSMQKVVAVVVNYITDR